MKINTFRSLSILTLILGQAAIAQVTSAPVATTTVAVMKDSKKFDKKELVVKGKVEDYKKKTSKKGTKYTTFRLSEGGKYLNIYLKDHLKVDLKDGQTVEVRGIYRDSKNVGTSTFKNEIEITTVKGKKYGVKVLTTVKK